MVQFIVIHLHASRNGIEFEVYGTFDSMKSALNFRDRSERSSRKIHKAVVLELCSPESF